MATTMATAAPEAVTTSAAEVVRVAGRPDHGPAGARLSELFARHGATVLGLCRLMLRHREEAEDAVQQTFLAAYRSLLNGTNPRHPAAWLATIARNECRGRIEQRMREPLGEREPESMLPDPVAAAAGRADLAELWQAIGGLPRQQREALLLREFSGLSYVELAEALAVSEPAVGSLLFRARRDLRLRLKLVYGSVGGVTPLAAIREALARAIGGMPDPSTTGGVAKLVSAPLVAKLTAGAAAVLVAGGTVAAVETHSIRPGSSWLSAPARPATAGAPASALRVAATSKPRLAGRSSSVHVSSVPARAAITSAAAPVQSTSSGAPASAGPPHSAPAAPGGAAPALPATPASKPVGPSSSDGQGSSAGGDDHSSGVGSGGDGSGSGSEGQGGDDGTSSGPGDSAGEGSGSSGSDDPAESSGDGDGSSDEDSGSGEGHDGHDHGDGGDSGDD